MRRRYLSALCLLVLLSLQPLSLNSANVAEQVRVGVLSFRPVEETTARWAPLADTLSAAVPEYEFLVEPMTYEELEAASARRQLDFVLTNPAHYVLLVQRYGLSAPLATQVNRLDGQEVSVFGGVIIVRSGDDRFRNLADLSDARIAHVARDSLGGFQTQAYEFKDRGYSLPPAENLVALGMPHDQVVDAVLAGDFDAGFVRTGLLETMIDEGRLAPDALRVLNEQTMPDLPFATSTQLYPEWPFAATPHSDPELARRVVAALLALKDQPEHMRPRGVAGFNVPADYSAVETMLRELRVPPFDFAPELTRMEALRQFQREVLAVVVAVLLLGLLLTALAVGWIRLKRLDGIIKRSPVVAMSWRNEPGWPVSYVSDNISLFGYEPQQLLSGDLAYDRLIHPDDLERIGRDVASHLANGPDDYRQVYRLRHGDGHWIWVDDRTWLTRNRHGKVTRINGILRDATAEHEAEQRLEHSRHLLRYIIEHMHGAVAVHDLDMNYVYVSQKYLDMFNINDVEVIGKHHYEVFPDLPQKLRDVHQRVLQGEVLAADDDPFYHPDGSMDWTRWECRPWFSADGAIGGLIVYTEITTQRKEAELELKQHAEALARNNARLELLATVFKAAREGIIITDADGRIEEVNAAFERITGYPRDEVVGKNPSMLRSGRHGKGFYRLMWRQLSEHGYWSGEIWNRRKSGEIYPQSISMTALRGNDNQVVRYVALFSDVSEQKQHEQQLQYIAQYDPLTGLPNRQLITERLHHAMARCDELGQSMAVVYLDLDEFKDINEALGQEAGDRLLCELSQRLKASLHQDDSVARIGGDELAVLLANLDSETAALPRLDELLALTQSVFAYEGREIQLSASLGVTFYPQAEPVEADQLLRQADQAMYQAKLAGKNRYCLFDTAEDQATRGMHETLHRIRRGLENDEFILFFQPKVNMRSGEVLGAEALIRWQHPDRGLLSPAQFLPLVEQDDLALEMGQWVVEQALSQLEAWQSAGHRLVVGVNIFGRQLQHEDFVADLRDTLARYPSLEPGQLELEVLETSALEDMERVSVVIEDCAEMGVRCALDDFGTGYSSLTYLKRLPASILKIDQSFIRDMLEDPDDLAIVTGILGLARSFQRESVAEGVETVAHGEILLDLDCELAQGYGIARPMPAEDFLAWMEQWQPGPSWKDRRARQLDERDLITCMVEHRAWVAALDRHVETGAPPPELDASECRFGRWLNEQFAGPHASSEALQEIDQLHQYLHEKADSVIRDRAARKPKDAERGMEAVYRLRDDLLQRLQALDFEGYNDASDTTDQTQRRDQD